jgi:hypothetical protein
MQTSKEEEEEEEEEEEAEIITKVTKKPNSLVTSVKNKVI